VPNSSATGGTLVATYESPDDAVLGRLLQPTLAGLADIEGSLVRPLWQLNPPPVPDHNVDWIAFGIESRTADANAYLEPGADDTALIRHEEITWQVSCYGPNGMRTAGRIRDGLEIRQNRVPLDLAGLGFVAADFIANLAEVVNGRFYARADLTLIFRREIRRGYAILPLAGVSGDIRADDSESQPLTETVTVEEIAP